jgi:hypothetical protein
VLLLLRVGRVRLRLQVEMAVLQRVALRHRVARAVHLLRKVLAVLLLRQLHLLLHHHLRLAVLRVLLLRAVRVALVDHLVAALLVELLLLLLLRRERMDRGG